MPEAVDLGFAVKLPPHRAIEYFRSKGYRITWDWKESLAEANAKAFTVAKATKMEVLRTIRDEMDKAISEGVAFHNFQKELRSRLQKLGWWGKRVLDAPDGTSELVQLGSVTRLKTIFRTNLNTAYNAGRYKQQLALAKSKVGRREYWQYLAVMDSRTRPAHRNLHGKVFHYSDPFWSTFYPPNGWNCRCRVRALTGRQVKSRGLAVEKGSKQLEQFTQQIGIDKQTGEVLTQKATRYKAEDAFGKSFVETPDVGFDYNPGVGWALWDKRGALPDQVGGRGSSVAIIEPDQKTYKDYGLPSIKDYPSDLLEQAPAILSGSKSLDDALEQIDKAILQGKEWRQISTPVEPIIIHRQHILHVLLKREQQRERFARYIMPTLMNPNEVWLTGYKDGFRRQFVKFFKSKNNMLVVVRESQDGSLFWNALPTSKMNYVDGRRKGVLLYKNE